MTAKMMYNEHIGRSFSKRGKRLYYIIMDSRYGSPKRIFESKNLKKTEKELFRLRKEESGYGVIYWIDSEYI